MPIEILQPKRESEVYPRAHKAGVRSTNQMEVRAAGDRGGGFPPGAGAGAFLWDWCAGDSGPLGCMFEGRCGAGQGALGWEAGRTADRGAGEGQAPKEQGPSPGSTEHPTTIPQWFP